MSHFFQLEAKYTCNLILSPQPPDSPPHRAPISYLMAPQRSQSPRDRATRASPIGSYRLARSDERWTGRSVYYAPPDPQHYPRSASAGNASRARRQASNGPFGAGHGISFSQRGLYIGKPFVTMSTSVPNTYNVVQILLHVPIFQRQASPAT